MTIPVPFYFLLLLILLHVDWAWGSKNLRHQKRIKGINKKDYSKGSKKKHILILPALVQCFGPLIPFSNLFSKCCPWSPGPLVLWSLGPLVLWSSGPLIPGSLGASVLW